jgi:hypothetical protein
MIHQRGYLASLRAALLTQEAGLIPADLQPWFAAISTSERIATPVPPTGV